MSRFNLIRGDCLEAMAKLPEGSIDMVLCDLPYGTTQNKWDAIIPFADLWSQYERLTRTKSAIVLTAAQPFTSALVMSNIKSFRYSLVWHKSNATGFLNAKRMPLRAHEDILVFYGSLPVFNPQKSFGHPRKVSTAKHRINCAQTSNYGDHLGRITYDSTDRYPTSVLDFPSDKQRSALHPTQKPVVLMEYLIKTYTNEGDTVLDNCMGSGTTGVACLNTNRNFIGIEKDDNYFSIATNRIEKREFDITVGGE
jgi:DNA modification methylase